MNTRNLTVILLSSTTLLLAIAGVFYLNGYRINTSISYPTGLYRLVNDPAVYHKTDLVLFCPPDNDAMQLALYRDYIKPGLCTGGFTPVIKKVMATAGDTITFQGLVRIDGIAVPHARILKQDSKGRPLPVQSAITLAKNQYFMMSDHLPVVSFDSRYYGPVPAHNLIGHIKPVFTW
ncbi:conjugative transfer signal peptidase TraF (plasmid) [Citrobacter sp. OP27]